MKRRIKVITKTGTYIGTSENNINEFLGIRYSAPVGYWMHPKQPETTSKDIIEALKYGPACIQPYDIGELSSLGKTCNDCLNLNIWTKSNNDIGKPVMFYMHGGSYISGGGNDPITCGKNIIEVLPDGEDAVVITISYRLGIFGCMDLTVLEGDTSAYSDTLALFLEDELTALRWVYENIEAFGGDPHNITIFGQSAGSMSVAYLMANKEARNYISKGIMESGIPGFGLATKDAKKEMSLRVFESLGIKTIDELLTCGDEFWHEHYEKILGPNLDVICPRVPDGKLIRETFWEDFVNGVAGSIPLMIGIGSGEMDLIRYNKGKIPATADEIIKNLFDKYIPAGAPPGQLRPQGHETLIKKFMDKGSDEIKKALDLYAAFATGIGTYQYANAQSRYTSTYLYVWDWMPDANLLTQPKFKSAFSPYGRSVHCAELPVLFNSGDIGYEVLSHWWMMYYEDQKFNKQSKDIVPNELVLKTVMTWYSFAKKGDPNNALIPIWPKYDALTRPAMNMSLEWKVKNEWAIEDLDILMRVEPIKA